ncbi:MAG: EAL domain-containing response regulator [Geminicoccaceae bacterium]
MIGEEDQGAGLGEAAAGFELEPDARAERHWPVIPLGPPRRAAFGAAGLARRPAGLLRVLCIEADPDDAELVGELLARAERVRFRLEHAWDGEAGLAKLATGGFDLCLLAHAPPELDGLELLERAGRLALGTPVILLSVCPAQDLDLAAIAAGAADFLDKEQLDVERLEQAALLALARRQPSDGQGAAPGRPAAETSLVAQLTRGIAQARRSGHGGALLLLALAASETGAAAAAPAHHEQAGTILRQAAREADTILPLECGRWAVLLEQIERPEHAATVAAKLLTLVRAGLADDGAPPSTCAGMALFPSDAGEAAPLVRLAEAALARARAGGDGWLCQHDRGAEALARTRLALAGALRRAIEHGALSLHFQPQVTLCSPKLALAAVVHWRHEQGGILEGRALRSLAEASGLLEQLDAWVIAAACQQARQWREAGLPIHVAVPLMSRRPLGRGDVARRLAAALAASGLEACRLEVEIEEPLLLDALETDGPALRRLRDLGVRLAVDAFGAGPMAIAVLRDAPLATVKLARAFLHGLPDDPRRVALLGPLIALAHRLELRVVAEGIEGQSQLQLLRAEGCDAVQALSSCPPLPADACTDWLRQAAWRT